jgi:hypothetical protein
MRNSCVQRPADRPLIIIHSEDLEFTGNDHCAAALISFFEYWHNFRIRQREKAIEENDIREAHGDARTQNESLVQFHTLQQFEEGMCGIYRKDAIRSAIRKLVDLKVVEQFRNPNPRYSFDKTSHFLFHPEVLNDWFNATEDGKSSIEGRKSAHRGAENQRPSSENRTRCAENRTAIQEITSEITEEKNIYTPHRIAKAAAASKTPVERIDRVSAEQQAIWFEEFWNRIPTADGPKPFWRKIAKTDAQKAFGKLVTTQDCFGKLLEITAERYLMMISREESHRPYPASWIRSQPWNDLGETSPPQVAIARAAANGSPVARPSRKEETRAEFARLVFESMNGNG